MLKTSITSPMFYFVFDKVDEMNIMTSLLFVENFFFYFKRVQDSCD